MLVRRLSGAFDERAVELARTLVDQAATALALVHARAEAGTDAVAGCMNHRAMRRRLDEEIGRATRTGSPLSCILIDLDDFKRVNDDHGHQAGDAVLREVVQALVGEFRAFDRVARYGGDEFVVILPNADLRSAAAAADAGARAACARCRPVGTKAGISASIGVAQWHAPMGVDELLEACDQALLRSKREGKGRVTRAPEPARLSARRAGLRGGRRARRASARDSARLLACRTDPRQHAQEMCDDAEQLWRQGARSTPAGSSYEIFRLDALQQRFDVARLPFSLKVLLENLLRTEGNGSVDAADIEALASWDAKAQPSKEIAFTPARVLMQDFTGVPGGRRPRGDARRDRARWAATRRRSTRSRRRSS